MRGFCLPRAETPGPSAVPSASACLSLLKTVLEAERGGTARPPKHFWLLGISGLPTASFKSQNGPCNERGCFGRVSVQLMTGQLIAPSLETVAPHKIQRLPGSPKPPGGRLLHARLRTSPAGPNSAAPRGSPGKFQQR